MPDRPILAPRELEILTLIAQGFTDQEIADKLGLSRRSVSARIPGILLKLGATRRTDAVARALSLGLIEVSSE